MIIRKFGADPIPAAILDVIEGATGYPIERADIIDCQGHGLVDSYKRSVQSISAAFECLCMAFNFKEKLNEELIEKLIKYNKKIEKKYSSQLDARNPDEYQNVLQEYLKDVWFLITKKLNVNDANVLKLLTKADEYVVLSNQRPILATLTTTKYHNEATKQLEDGYLLQMEVPQPVIDSEKIQEFLNANPKSNKQPEWYVGMSDKEKMLFDYLMRDVKTAEDVMAKIQTISSRHRSIPGVANFSKHVMCLIDKKGNVVYQPHHRYRSSMIASRDINKENKTLRIDFAFHNLCEIIRNDIEQFLEEKKYLYKLIDSEGEIDRKKVEKLIADKIEQSPILIQTLITPLALAAKFVPDPALYEDKLDAIKKLLAVGLTVSLRSRVNGKEIIEEFKVRPKEECLIETNHPMNKARNIASTGSVMEVGDTKNNSMKLVALARKGAKKLRLMLDPNKADARKAYAELLEMAATDLEILLNNNPWPVIGYFTEKNQRELHLAALEELITVRLNGISYGSCVSGKDRKGLQTMYVDAMEIYYHLYNEFPKYDDVGGKRKHFVDIFVQLFLTQHQQMNAGQNAIGADGIKTPSAYLPEDIQAAIKERAGNLEILGEVDRLASNNEFHKIVSGLDELPLDRVVALNTDYAAFDPNIASTKVDLKTALIKIVELIKNPLWEKLAVGIGDSPIGIENLRKIINDPLVLHFDSVTLIKALAAACESRSASGKHRKSNTRDFYNAIRDIAAHVDNLSTANTSDLNRIYDQFHEKKLSASAELMMVPMAGAASAVAGMSSSVKEETALHPLVAKLNQHSDTLEIKVNENNYLELIKKIILAKFWGDKGKASSIGPQLFSSKKSTKVPSGINKMQDLLTAGKDVLDSDKLIGKFASFIKEKDDKNRAFCTQRFYQIILGLRDNKGQLTPEIAKELNTFVFATNVSLVQEFEIKHQ